MKIVEDKPRRVERDGATNYPIRGKSKSQFSAKV